IVRTELKDFLTQHVTADGWASGQGGCVHALYRLHRLHESPPGAVVFVVEGEKDVDNLEAAGLLATTKAHGAKSEWLPTYTESLRGKRVVVIPDNDTAGWKCARGIVSA